MKRHVLKTWPDYFEAVRLRFKTFECRLRMPDEDPIEVGDLIELREWDPQAFVTDRVGVLGETGAGDYTGRNLVRAVSYVLELDHSATVVHDDGTRLVFNRIYGLAESRSS